jgi:hypothetical protein
MSARPNPESPQDDPSATYGLKELGCSRQQRLITGREIMDASAPGNFSYAAELLTGLGWSFGLALAVSLVVYGLVRAIGWVISGFVASG